MRQRAWRYALDVNREQGSRLASHCGASRVAFNFGLGLVKDRLDARATGEEVEVPWSLPALRREWNQAKAEVAPWWEENSKEAYSSGLDGLARGLRGFSDSKGGRRQGRKVMFPRFRKKGDHDSCRFTTGALRVEDERHVVLPRLGRLRTWEDTSSLLRPLSTGARILSATVSREADRWYVSFTVEVAERGDAPTAPDGAAVGVDLGLHALAVLSTGEVVEGPKALERNLRKLQRLSRAHSRRKKGSANRHRAAQKLARCHARIRHLRQDHLHKLTTRLAKSHGKVVVEDLNVQGMLRNHRLARSIADAGWYEFRRQLIYKTEWYGSELVVAPRFLPSTQLCSDCGERTGPRGLEKLEVRRWACRACGCVHERDENAALVLAGIAEMMENVAVSAVETENGSGAVEDRRGAGVREEGATELQRASVSEPTGSTGGRHRADVPFVP
ncbi:MAG: IS607 family element RNA-guided endonuclease TnpB [Candidatus Dormibacteraceae bacterium]